MTRNFVFSFVVVLAPTLTAAHEEERESRNISPQDRREYQEAVDESILEVLLNLSNRTVRGFLGLGYASYLENGATAVMREADRLELGYPDTTGMSENERTQELLRVLEARQN